MKLVIKRYIHILFSLYYSDTYFHSVVKVSNIYVIFQPTYDTLTTVSAHSLCYNVWLIV